MTLRAGLLALVLTATVLSACSENPTPAASSAPVTPTSTASAASTQDPEATETTDREAIADLVAFTSPSGNVGCCVDSTSARCDIMERNWTPPPRPADCEFDYGQGISLTVGQTAHFVCAGDTTLGAGERLDYGKSMSVGTLRCDSAEAGITCRDSSTGHGFSIAREAFRLF